MYKSVQTDNDIKGVNMFNREIKNTAFADDATFMLDESQKTFFTLITKLNELSKVSGLKLNNKISNQKYVNFVTV